MKEIIRVKYDSDGKGYIFEAKDFLLFLCVMILGFFVIPMSYFTALFQSKLICKEEFYKSQIRYYQRKLKEDCDPRSDAQR